MELANRRDIECFRCAIKTKMTLKLVGFFFSWNLETQHNVTYSNKKKRARTFLFSHLINSISVNLVIAHFSPYFIRSLEQWWNQRKSQKWKSKREWVNFKRIQSISEKKTLFSVSKLKQETNLIIINHVCKFVKPSLFDATRENIKICKQSKPTVCQRRS